MIYLSILLKLAAVQWGGAAWPIGLAAFGLSVMADMAVLRAAAPLAGSRRAIRVLGRVILLNAGCLGLVWLSGLAADCLGIRVKEGIPAAA